MDNQLEARQPASPSEWTEVDIDLAMRVLALHGGHIDRAAAILEGEGRPIPKKTLKKWRDGTHAVRYENTLGQMRKEIGAAVSDRAMDIAASAAEVEADLVRAAGESLSALEPKELTKAALNMAILKKNNVETARVLRNEPTVVVESRDVSDTLEALKSLGIIDVQERESPAPRTEDRALPTE